MLNERHKGDVAYACNIHVDRFTALLVQFVLAHGFRCWRCAMTILHALVHMCSNSAATVKKKGSDSRKCLIASLEGQ